MFDIQQMLKTAFQETLDAERPMTKMWRRFRRPTMKRRMHFRRPRKKRRRRFRGPGIPQPDAQKGLEP